MGVEPKIGGFYPPKWMVKIMENPIKMDDLGGFPPIFGNTHMSWAQTMLICRIPKLLFNVVHAFGDGCMVSITLCLTKKNLREEPPLSLEDFLTFSIVSARKHFGDWVV